MLAVVSAHSRKPESTASMDDRAPYPPSGPPRLRDQRSPRLVPVATAAPEQRTADRLQGLGGVQARLPGPAWFGRIVFARPAPRTPWSNATLGRGCCVKTRVNPV